MGRVLWACPVGVTCPVPADSFGVLRSCCLRGMRFVPKTLSCDQFAQQHFPKHPHCGRAFSSCCQFMLEHLDQDQSLILGRHGQSAPLGHWLAVG